jgi:lipopolysaccharide transport system permease protein
MGTTTRARPHAVYTPASQIRTPGALLMSIGRDLVGSRELSWRLFVRDLSAQYRQTLFGVVWAFIPPIVTSLIFVVLQSRNLVNLGTFDIPYPVYVMVGTILWQVFVEAINAPLKAVTAAKPMLAKINFPREALIVSSFYSVAYGLLIKFIVIIGILLLFGVKLTWGLPLALVPMLALALCGLCAGLLLTPFGMLYADVSTGLPVATQLLFFVTPVVYLPPQTFPFSLIGTLNPISPLLVGARDLITKGVLANAPALAAVSGITLIGLIAGLIIYRAALPIFIERTSA